MKKLLLTVAPLVAILLLALSITSCETTSPSPNDTTPTTYNNESNTTDTPEDSENISQVCSHEWIDATCQMAKTCSLCGLTEGKTLEHTGGTATCMNKAICDRCHNEYGELSTHTWTNATCTEPKICLVCNATEGVALEHKWENNICTYCNLKNEKEIQFDAAKQSYNLLNYVADDCETIMYSIYGAWHFSIYEADDYLSTQSCFDAFIDATGMEYDATLDSLNNVLASIGYTDPTGTQQLAALRTMSIALDIVHDYYASNGMFDNAQSNIDNARAELKKLTNEYSDYTNYSTLREYYTCVSGYFEFCYSPSGSFSQLSTTIDNYETHIRDSQIDLSFTFD